MLQRKSCELIENITIKHDDTSSLGFGLRYYAPQIKSVEDKKSGASQDQIPGAVVFVIAIYRLTRRADTAITLQEFVTETCPPSWKRNYIVAGFNDSPITIENLPYDSASAWRFR